MSSTAHNITIRVIDGRTISCCENSNAGIHKLFELSLCPDSSFSTENDSLTNGIIRLTPQAVTSEDGAWLDIIITNETDSPVEVKSIHIHAETWGITVFQGGFSYLLASCASQTHWLVVKPISGDYFADLEGSLGDASILINQRLAPTEEIRLNWQARWYGDLLAALTAVTPSWYPEIEVIEPDEELYIDFPDGIITANTLAIREEFPTTLLTGKPGRHLIRLTEATSKHLISIGVAKPLTQLIHEALPTASPELAAWLRVNLVQLTTPNDNELDQLDISIAEAMENPGVFAIAAAASAAPLLGRSLLADAIDALAAIEDPDAIPGSYFAALYIYNQALTMENTAADKLINHLLMPRPARSIEGKLICEPQQASQILKDLDQLAGWDAPGSQYLIRPYTTALLKFAAELGFYIDDPTHFHVLHTRTESWARVLYPNAEGIAWLLW